MSAADGRAGEGTDDGGADRESDGAGGPGGDEPAERGRGRDRIELLLTVILALAAVGTAWAGFQSAKWSGVQANSYAQASAARTESSRSSAEAGQLVTIDVITFTQWLTALNDEIVADPSKRPQGMYTPDPGSVSGFLFNRFRDEFEPAVSAWLMRRPLTDPKAPSTPFDMPEYRVAAEEKAERLVREADRKSARARQANQRSDNYVLTAVLFALVLFFAAVAGRARPGRAQWVLLGLTVAALLAAVSLLLSYPVTV
ncbi:hypothetical protein OTC26_021445 [Streptomyces tirandamycinicus]|uniref:hypothetical protein n=1 Tax=Streptomyces tirandamycinicus TaxID=2174846 RepID=UPI00226D6FED|nr:hypothetical protein [Streptomyces tirandamycinicus]MCY0980450.1 hypothetical protein [Streptomyces tirandamycinicus]